MEPAIGLIETNSIAVGIRVGDAMVKRAPVNLLEARTVCPGKYIVLVGGYTGPVGESMQAGKEAAADALVDQLFLPNVHPSLFPAIAGAVSMDEVEALGIVETISVASTIVAADAAVKAAAITLTEIRLANGLGGKSFTLMVGDVPNVQAAVEAGVQAIKEDGSLIRWVVIPQLHEDMRQKIA
jgi:microcompartment protein CcmL/EutN